MKAKFILLFTCLIPFLHAQDTRILYIRHAEVPGNDPTKYAYTGCRTDQNLTDVGTMQAAECAKRITELQKKGAIGTISAIYASPLRRALETAEPVTRALELSVQPREDLKEIDWGYADGQLVHAMNEEFGPLEDQVKEQFPERKMRWNYLPVFPEAETYNALLKRSLNELKAIAEDHEGETVIVIGHGRVLKTLISDALDSETVPTLSNCCVAEFTYNPEGLRFIGIMKD